MAVQVPSAGSRVPRVLVGMMDLTEVALVERLFAAFQSEATALVRQKAISREDCSALVSSFARIAAGECVALRDAARAENPCVIQGHDTPGPSCPDCLREWREKAERLTLDLIASEDRGDGWKLQAQEARAEQREADAKIAEAYGFNSASGDLVTRVVKIIAATIRSQP